MDFVINKSDTFYEEIGGKLYAPHDINEVTDFPFNWEDWLEKSGNDTIASCLILPQAPLMEDRTPGFDTQHVTAWIKGGADNQTLSVTCRITTAAGRIQDRSIYLRCKKR